MGLYLSQLLLLRYSKRCVGLYSDLSIELNNLIYDTCQSLFNDCYLFTGCHQSIIAYSSQASWAAMAGPLALNILAGVWNIRLYGCGENAELTHPDPGEEPLLTLTSTSGKPVSLPPRIRKVCDIPSLLEMSLRQAHCLRSDFYHVTLYYDMKLSCCCVTKSHSSVNVTGLQICDTKDECECDSDGGCPPLHPLRHHHLRG